MAFALGEQRDQHIGAGHLVAAGILDMQHRALDHPLEAGGGLGFLAILDHQGDEFLVDIFLHRAAQRLDVHIAGLHHLAGVGVVHQRQKQMLQRRIFMMPVAGQFDRMVQGLLQAARQGRHHSFSMVHCRGC